MAVLRLCQTLPEEMLDYTCGSLQGRVEVYRVKQLEKSATIKTTPRLPT